MPVANMIYMHLQGNAIFGWKLIGFNNKYYNTFMQYHKMSKSKV